MLKLTKNTVLEGQTIVDDVVIASYHAEVSSEHPDAVQIQSWQYDVDKCIAYREQVTADRAQFEDAVYALKNTVAE